MNIELFLPVLQSRLEEVQNENCRVKADLEIALSELQKVKFGFKIESMHNQQLEERHKSTLQAKRDLQEKVSFNFFSIESPLG